jgi:hypothetical protein
MRMPLVSPIDSRDGSDDKDALLRNVLGEMEEGGPIAAVRPGLATIATSTGNGSGVTAFDGVLISVFGTTVRYSPSLTTIDAVAAGTYDFCQSTL